jgi:hypothetical protein
MVDIIDIGKIENHLFPPLLTLSRLALAMASSPEKDFPFQATIRASPAVHRSLFMVSSPRWYSERN